jgi:4,5-DOPA dioxygenase extradiol
LGEDARLSAPTPEHYLPLLYVLGAGFDDEPARVFTDVIAMASISMLGFVLGHPG